MINEAAFTNPPERIVGKPYKCHLSEMGVIRQLDRALPKFRFPRGLNIILWNVNSRATLPAQSSEYESVGLAFRKKKDSTLRLPTAPLQQCESRARRRSRAPAALCDRLPFASCHCGLVSIEFENDRSQLQSSFVCLNLARRSGEEMWTAHVLIAP